MSLVKKILKGDRMDLVQTLSQRKGTSSVMSFSHQTLIFIHRGDTRKVQKKETGLDVQVKRGDETFYLYMAGGSFA